MTAAIDPILLEVFNNALISVGDEMCVAMKRSARSMQGRNGDCSTVLTDARGDIIAQAVGSLFHMGYAKAVMPHVLKKWGNRLKEGDMIALNDPYQGLSHLPDMVVIAPIFWQGRIAGFANIVTHHADIGGRYPGGQGIASEDLYSEGLRISNVKIYENGALNEGVMDLILANVRAPEEVTGDIEGQVAACKRGIKGVQDLLDRYGLETFESCIAHLRAYTEQQMRAGISKIPDGDYSSEDYFEEDGRGGPGVNLKVTFKKWGYFITADFTGTDPQARSAINVPWGQSCSAVYLVCRYMLAPHAFSNAGVFAPIEVVAPEGCLVRPKFPGAVGARGMMLWRIVDIVTAALGKACPERALADGDGGPSSMSYMPSSHDSQKTFVVHDFYMSGWGARTTKDGIDGGIALALGGGTDGASIEVMEAEYPFLVEANYFEPDTGGAGKYRGSLSVARRFRYLKPGRVMLRTSRSNSVPRGLNGGNDGTPFRATLQINDRESELPRSMFIDTPVEPEDVIVHTVPGAAGFGDPFERDPNLVLRDVLDEKISLAYARKAYGVEIDFKGEKVDMMRTVALRREGGA